jgi:dephospho-CoA kinase
VFVAEIPLLFETDRDKDFDYSVAVTVSEERRRAWSGERGVDEAALRAIEARQLTGEEKANRADLVVQNDGDLDRLEDQAKAIGHRILRERRPDGHLR